MIRTRFIFSFFLLVMAFTCCKKEVPVTVKTMSVGDLTATSCKAGGRVIDDGG